MDYNYKKRTHKNTDIIIFVLYKRYFLMCPHLSLHAVPGDVRGGGGGKLIPLFGVNECRDQAIDRGKR